MLAYSNETYDFEYQLLCDQSLLCDFFQLILFNGLSIFFLSVLMIAAGPIVRRFLGRQRQIMWSLWQRKMNCPMRRRVQGLVTLGPVSHEDDGDDDGNDAGGADDGGFD